MVGIAPHAAEVLPLQGRLMPEIPWILTDGVPLRLSEQTGSIHAFVRLGWRGTCKRKRHGAAGCIRIFLG